jgi:hypothetical protein
MPGLHPGEQMPDKVLLESRHALFFRLVAASDVHGPSGCWTHLGGDAMQRLTDFRQGMLRADNLLQWVHRSLSSWGKD